MSEHQTVVWSYPDEPLGEVGPTQEGDGATWDFIDYPGFSPLPRLDEHGVLAFGVQPVGEENGKPGQSYYLPMGRCPCCVNPTVGRWLCEDPVGFVDAEGALFPFAEAQQEPAPDSQPSKKP